MKSWLLAVVAVGLLAGTGRAEEGVVSSLWHHVQTCERFVSKAYYRSQGRIRGAMLRPGMTEVQWGPIFGKLGVERGQMYRESFAVTFVRYGFSVGAERDVNGAMVLRSVSFLPFFGD